MLTKLLSRIFNMQAEPSHPFIQGPGDFAAEVVGESRYQEALERICGTRCEDGTEFECTALIVPEDQNPYDKKAVRIDIKGHTVGYLSRETARSYRKQLRLAGHKGAIACAAKIVGWDRGPHDRGSYGVKLDLPIAEETP